MFTDRDYDIWFLEAQILNEEIEQEFRKEKLGKRGMQNAEGGLGKTVRTQSGEVAGPAGPTAI